MPGVGRRARLMVDWTVGLLFGRSSSELGQLGHPPDLKGYLDTPRIEPRRPRASRWLSALRPAYTRGRAERALVQGRVGLGSRDHVRAVRARDARLRGQAGRDPADRGLTDEHIRGDWAPAALDHRVHRVAAGRPLPDRRERRRAGRLRAHGALRRDGGADRADGAARPPAPRDRPPAARDRLAGRPDARAGARGGGRRLGQRPQPLHGVRRDAGRGPLAHAPARRGVPRAPRAGDRHDRPRRARAEGRPRRGRVEAARAVRGRARAPVAARVLRPRPHLPRDDRPGHGRGDVALLGQLGRRDRARRSPPRPGSSCRSCWPRSTALR